MGTEGDNLGVLAEDFMAEYPDVTVEVTAVPWDAAHDRIINAIAGEQTPDVSLLGSTWMGEFAATGGLAPVPSNFDSSAFFEGAWNGTVIDGQSYGVPWYVETRMIYYRTDLAEAAGFAEPPGTWDELKQMAQGMVEGGAEWGLNLQPGGTGSWQTFMPFAWQAGGGVVDEAGEFILNSEANVSALEYYASYFQEELSPTSLEPGALETGFIDGSIGAFISGPWHIGILEEQGAEEGTWSVAHMPTEESGTSFVGGGNLAVFEASENKDAAWAFVEYLSRPEVQVKWYETVADLPAVQAAWDDEALSGDELLSAFGEQLEDAQSPPTIATWEQIANEIDTNVEQATIGDLDAQAAADAMQSAAESIGTGGS
jgi:multiple sugar transport system substrate-binding protein